MTVSDFQVVNKPVKRQGEMKIKNRLLLVLAIGLALRLGLLVFFWDQPLTIVDENHYQQIAENLLNHHEFARKAGQPTAIRPPLYPLFLSAIYFVTGGIDSNAIRIAQILLSLGMIVVLYLLGKGLFDERVGLLAAFIFAVYPSFLFFTHLLLTEVLFTFFLLLFVYCFLQFLRTAPKKAGGESDHRNRNILLAGLFLGLGALTRSILYPFIFVAILFILFGGRERLTAKIKWVCLLAFGFALVVGPWATRNYLLFKEVVIIDTMGGLNLYMGNYEHTPLNRAWTAIDLTGNKTWYYGHEKLLAEMNEAQKQEWAADRAKGFILSHKWLTLKRDLIKFANFWGLEREVIGPIINGNWPAFNKKSYLAAITFFIFSAYGIVLIFSVLGLLNRFESESKVVFFFATLLIFFSGMHALVFGHSRYHLPLMPLLAVFASWSFLNLLKIWRDRNLWRQKIALILIAALLVAWAREIIFIEGARYFKNFLI